MSVFPSAHHSRRLPPSSFLLPPSSFLLLVLLLLLRLLMFDFGMVCSGLVWWAGRLPVRAAECGARSSFASSPQNTYQKKCQTQGERTHVRTKSLMFLPEHEIGSISRSSKITISTALQNSIPTTKGVFP